MSSVPQGARFFQAIVVMGAAIGAHACGGHTSSQAGDAPSNGGAGGGGGIGATGGRTNGPEKPSDCDDPAHFKCASYFPHVACVCDPSLPAKPEDCAHTSQLVCECKCPPDQICICPPPPGSDVVVNCKCDSTKPAGPEECPTTADFQCNDWGPPWSDCYCTEGAPNSAEECPEYATWTCQSYEPPIGCKCFTIITK